jgi:hypothetical protein
LTTTTGYTFVGVGANSFSYTGATSITNVAGSGGTISITIIFPATVSPPTGQQLAEDFNAISPGSASASGETVTLLKDLALTGPLTVPAGVALDLASNHKSLTLGDNAVLTVNGAINAEASHDKSEPPVLIAGNGKLLVDSATENPATINGAGVIHLKSQGALLAITSGKKMILDGDITLDGLMTAVTATAKKITSMPADYADDSDNNASLVIISSGGAFIMTDGTIGYNNDSGVHIQNSGSFTMNGGEICGNGGPGLGVYDSSFTMNNGEIYDNTSGTDGGGLLVNGGTFTMYGGVIKNNRARPDGWGYGGGVRLWGPATFIMAGGTIYGNSAGEGIANKGSGASLSIGQSIGHAYWGDGTTSIGTTDETLHGGTPTGTVE